MATILREPELSPAPVEPPSEAPAAAAVERPCPTCGAALADGQDWCLECGEAAGDRLGSLPGWRTAVSVLAVTLALASGAVAAAYAALKSDSQRAASTPSEQAALPPADPAPPAVPPPAAAAVPPAAGDAATPPAAKPPKASAPKAGAEKAATGSSAPPPAAAAPVTPSAPSTSSTKESSSGEDDAGAGANGTPAPARALAAVGIAGARTYNPYGRPANAFGAASRAVDGNPSTSWTAELDPSDAGRSAVGLVLDLGSPSVLRQLRLRTSTPGMTVEIYGTTSTGTPDDIESRGWEQLQTRLDVASSDTIPLPRDTTKFRKVAVWITEGPLDGNLRVTLSELSLRG